MRNFINQAIYETLDWVDLNTKIQDKEVPLSFFKFFEGLIE